MSGKPTSLPEWTQKVEDELNQFANDHIIIEGCPADTHEARLDFHDGEMAAIVHRHHENGCRDKVITITDPELRVREMEQQLRANLAEQALRELVKAAERAQELLHRLGWVDYAYELEAAIEKARGK